MSLMGTILQIIVSVIIISPILWLVGRSMVGGAKAKFTDAIWIVVLGIIINVILGTFVHGTIGFIVTLIVWIALIKHFFDAGWGKAILIGIIAIIVLIIIAFVLAFLGIVAIAGLSSLPGLGGLGGY
jgi:sterol desaturase/sphingolipid hydroxylase (fatty acid hydroxylase superfamily)